MLNYLLRRLSYSLLVLWGVATLVFLLFNVLPGSRARLTKAQRSEPTSIEATRRAQGLDKSLWTRYGLYLNDLSPIGVTSARKLSEAPMGVRLTRLKDSSYLSLKSPYLGRSYRTKQSVANVLGRALPGTLTLALMAMLLATVLGLALGILAALKKGTFWDMGTIAASLAGISMPSFFAGLIIAYISGCLISDYAGLNMIQGHFEYGASPAKRLSQPNLILPAFALAIRPMAIIIQHTRSAILEVLSQDYIRTAYAKGLRKTRVVLKHALPNALNPVLAASSGWLAELLAGSVFVEYIFGWKGIGRLTVEALEQFDFPLLIGAALLIALIYIIAKLLTDLLCGLLDPRVRLS
jgi:peptide/nickel transport system permease protein